MAHAYKTAFLANVVSEEDNVRQVSAKVALGEADAGFVYRSDVTPDIADQVIALPIPDAVNTLATYPIAVTDDSANPELAQKFIDYVLSDAGQDTLVKWNFISVRIPQQPATVTLPTDGTTTVDGQVLNPLTLTADILKTNYTAQTVAVTYVSGDETVSSTFTGVSLWDIIGSAQPNYNADVKNDKLSMYVVVTGSGRLSGGHRAGLKSIPISARRRFFSPMRKTARRSTETRCVSSSPAISMAVVMSAALSISACAMRRRPPRVSS